MCSIELELVRLARLAVVRFGRRDAHLRADVLLGRCRVVANDAHRHVINAGIAVLIERTDMALQASSGVGNRATRRDRGTRAHCKLVGRRRDADVHQVVVPVCSGRTPAGTGSSGLPCRAMMARVPSGLASRLISVVATLPTHDVLDAFTGTEPGWPGCSRGRADHIVVTHGVAADDAQAAFVGRERCQVVEHRSSRPLPSSCTDSPACPSGTRPSRRSPNLPVVLLSTTWVIVQLNFLPSVTERSSPP